MKIEYRKVNDNILQITTSDERWYSDDDGQTFHKSNTWVCSFWPKGKGFEEWLKKNGDEAEQLKRDAGNKGSKIHQAIEDLLRGVEVKFDAKYMNHDTNKEEDLTPDEYGSLMSFVSWWNVLNAAHKVEIIAIEKSAINKEIGVGYTLDLLLKVDGQLWVVDYKTSPSIYKSHELQVFFMKASEKADRCFLLQIGYKRNKDGYKLTEVEGDLWPQYLACKTVCDAETDGIVPLQKDYPLSLKLEGVKNES
jgi:hypothetical protein